MPCSGGLAGLLHFYIGIVEDDDVTWCPHHLPQVNRLVSRLVDEDDCEDSSLSSSLGLSFRSPPISGQALGSTMELPIPLFNDVHSHAL
jgi:hypothetical protein